MAQGSNLIQILCESSSSSEGTDEIFSVSFMESCSSTSSEGEHQPSSNFMVTIEEFSDLQFKRHFRLERNTVLYVIRIYKNTIQSQPDGRLRLSAEKEIYIFIWYLSNTTTFRETANLFGVCKSTMWKVVERVSQWLLKIGHEYIKWPSSAEVQAISSRFERKQNIPKIIGAIDCTHIRIKAPTENKTAYFNRNHFYSISLQVVSDARKRFISISCGEPGSLHDSRVLRRSELYKRAEENMADLFPNETYLIGDSAYPSLEWLVPPFKSNGSLSDIQNSFNFKHSSTRIVVEDAIGLLMIRFRRLLHFTEQANLNQVKNLVSCACILHNICMIQNDEICADEKGPDVQPQEKYSESEVHQQTSRRQRLLNVLLQSQVL